MNNISFLKIDKSDNLIVALQNIPKGTVVQIDGKDILIQEEVSAKHKFAIDNLNVDDIAVMYGVTVGKVVNKIECGGLVTTDNLKHATTAYKDQKDVFTWQPPTPFESAPTEFMGYRRENGKAGTANFWIFVPLVFCSNQELSLLKEVLPRALGYSKSTKYQRFANTLVKQIKDGKKSDEPILTIDSFDDQPNPLFPNIDGVQFLTHSLGCGNTPGDIDSLYALLANYITHPNVAGATVISLGCQKAELAQLKQEVQMRDVEGNSQVLYYERQAWDAPQDMLENIIQETIAGMQVANEVQREPIPVSELIVGVECGGSDGFSGISANPTIGRTIDHLIGAGASAILSEFPELCGVENELVSRCTSPEVSERFLHLLNNYRKNVQAIGFDFDLNPSPGNIRDGLITDAMKSAGAAKKGGTSPVVDAIDYSESQKEKGLTLLCTPGSDVESVTALVGAGANLVIFSTGLGTPTGNPIVPVLKVSTNSDMAKRLEYMIDLDTGPIISGEQTIDELAEKLQKMCVGTASGVYKAKASRLGQEDFIPWKRGLSL